MQAQVPPEPVRRAVGAAARLRPGGAERPDRGRGAARAQLMRGTIHLVSARDCARLHPLTAAACWRAPSPARRSSCGVVAAGGALEEVVAAGRELLAEAPRTRAELAAALGAALAGGRAARRSPRPSPSTAARAGAAARAVARQRRGAWALTEGLARRRARPGAVDDAVVRRYLAAFGPGDGERHPHVVRLHRPAARARAAAPEAAQLPRRAAAASCSTCPALRCPTPRRRRPRASCPSTTTSGSPTPIARGSSTGSARACRSRPALDRLAVVDGFFRAWWRITEEDGVATLAIDRFTPSARDPAGLEDEIAAEGERLRTLIATRAAPDA